MREAVCLMPGREDVFTYARARRWPGNGPREQSLAPPGRGTHLMCWVRFPGSRFQVPGWVPKVPVPVGMPNNNELLEPPPDGIRRPHGGREPGSWNPGTVPNQVITGVSAGAVPPA